MARGPNRRQSRELAFQVLYGLCFTPAGDEDELKRAFVLSPHNKYMNEANLEDDLSGFAWDLTRGVWIDQEKIDEIVNRFSHRWRADRMGKIELTLLRLALYELFWLDDTPPRAIINEALELADHFGEAGAKQLINGILDAAAKNRDSINVRGK